MFWTGNSWVKVAVTATVLCTKYAQLPSVSFLQCLLYLLKAHFRNIQFPSPYSAEEVRLTHREKDGK